MTLQTPGAEPLERLGWSDEIAGTFAPYAEQGLRPGRVCLQQRGSYRLLADDGEHPAQLAGRLWHEAAGSGDLPAIGDWVAFSTATAESKATIHGALPRRTKLARKAAGKETQEQVLAANVDVVFCVSGLDGDLNLRRLERFLTIGWESGAQPVVLLTKTDVCEDVPAALAEVETVAMGVPVHPLSSATGEGLDQLDTYFARNETAVLVGSSGVGKSTLINRLTGTDLLRTQELRRNGKGRHTTVQRELITLPHGGTVIDTPGIRELQLWTASDGLGATFEDVEAIAARCRFPDCSHEVEPDCAIRAALEAGTLEADRWDSYVRLQRELARLERRQDARARMEYARRWRTIAKNQRAVTKAKKKRR